MVNLVRSGTKQPQPFSTSAEGQARHLPLSVCPAFLPLRLPTLHLLQMPVRFASSVRFASVLAVSWPLAFAARRWAYSLHNARNAHGPARKPHCAPRDHFFLSFH